MACINSPSRCCLGKQRYSTQRSQVSDMLTTKLCGTHICPPSAVMPSQSMTGACHDCHPQHARRHVAHQLQHVFRRQLSQPYVHCLSWCELSQRRVSSRPFRSKATQNSAFASIPSDRHVREGSVSVVLLAGGSGKRMKASMPKQYLNLVGQPIVMHSLRTFGSMPEVGQIVVVCDPSYRDLFQQYLDQLPSRIQHSFAIPGVERQDSVYSGLQAIRSEAALVAIHDSARPLIDPTDAANCMADAQQVGAAVLGVPVKPTIKEVNSDGMVVKTLIRSNLWEVQTPQVIQPDMLREGFELVRQKKLEVTDDVSIIEALGRPVKVTQGSYTNIKVTTPDDMLVAEGFLMSKGVEDTLEAKQSDFSEASLV